jgi:phosphonatase-like hydrolase
MVETAFSEAIAAQGVFPGTEAYARSMAQVHRGRGRPPIDILYTLFPDNEARAQAANLTFERSYRAAIDRVGLVPMPGAVEAIDKLTGSGIRVCLISGFSRSTLGLVLDTLGWWNRVDLALCPEDVQRGCPWPDLVLTALLRLGIGDVREVAVAGDTESDILCGRRAGARIVAGVLTGAHPRDRLKRTGATHILDSIVGLHELVTDQPAPVPLGSVPPQVRLEGRHAGL